MSKQPTQKERIPFVIVLCLFVWRANGERLLISCMAMSGANKTLTELAANENAKRLLLFSRLSRQTHHVATLANGEKALKSGSPWWSPAFHNVLLSLFIIISPLNGARYGNQYHDHREFNINSENRYASRDLHFLSFWPKTWISVAELTSEKWKHRAQHSHWISN